MQNLHLLECLAEAFQSHLHLQAWHQKTSTNSGEYFYSEVNLIIYRNYCLTS